MTGRIINSRFWSDGFVVEKLNPLDRYLFLYFLTNDKTNLSGVYEISLRTISNETGIDKEEIIRMLERLRGKIEYKDNWICCVNFIKYQNLDNKSIVKGIQNKMDELPKSIQKWVILLRKKTSGTPVVDDSYTTTDKEKELKEKKRNINREHKVPTNNKNMTFRKLESDEPEEEIQLDESYTPKKKETKADTKVKTVFSIFTDLGLDVSTLSKNKTEREAALVLFEEKGEESIRKALDFFVKNETSKFCPDVSTPYALSSKWAKLVTFRNKK